MTEDFDADVIAAGTVGEPGARVFMLQVREGARSLTIKVEKTQVAQLAEHIRRVLADRPDTRPAPAGPFEPAEPMWAVGSIGLSYDAGAGSLLFALQEFRAEDDEPGEVAHVTITAAQAAALAAQVEELVAGGRPACPLCGYPLDPSGHVCPKTNGHTPPKL